MVTAQCDRVSLEVGEGSPATARTCLRGRGAGGPGGRLMTEGPPPPRGERLQAVQPQVQTCSGWGEPLS